MTAIAQATSDEDIAAAAEWFAALKTPATPWIKVIEQNTVPKTYLGQGRMRFIDPDVKTTEPIGNRIIMLPMDTKRARLRDPRSGAGFNALVPVGSVAKGIAKSSSIFGRIGVLHLPHFLALYVEQIRERPRRTQSPALSPDNLNQMGS